MLITINTQTITAANSDAQDAVDAASKIMKDDCKDNKLEEYSLELMPSKTWSRIVRVITWRETGKVISRSAWAFLDAEGNIWKAASWKAPAKNKIRGTLENLHDPKRVRMWQYGVS